MYLSCENISYGKSLDFFPPGPRSFTSFMKSIAVSLNYVSKVTFDAAPVLIESGWYDILRYFSLPRAGMVVKKREGARVKFWNRAKSAIKAGKV